MVRADAQVPAVAAASLVAKVYRDGIMAALHQSFPFWLGQKRWIRYSRPSGRPARVRLSVSSSPALHSNRFVRWPKASAGTGSGLTAGNHGNRGTVTEHLGDSAGDFGSVVAHADDSVGAELSRVLDHQLIGVRRARSQSSV